MPEPNKKYIDLFKRHKLLAGLSDNTIRHYCVMVYEFLLWYGMDKDMYFVTKDDVEGFIYYIKVDKKLKPSSISNHIVGLRVFLSDIIGKDKAIPMFEGLKVKVPLVKVRDDEILNDDDIRKMIAVCNSERDRALLSLLYSSGCRSGEIMGLRVRDVSFSRYGASIHVNGKTGERDVDLFIGVPELKAYYNVHPHLDDPNSPFWVQITGEQPLAKRGLSALLDRLKVRAGIPKTRRVYPHAFRHRRATDCAEFMTVADMKEMFGWTDGSDMPSVYVHSSRKKVAEKLMKQAGIKVPEQQMPTSMVKQCPVCGCINTANAIICVSCNSMLEEKEAVIDNELRDFLRDHMQEILDYKKEHDKKENKTE